MRDWVWGAAVLVLGVCLGLSHCEGEIHRLRLELGSDTADPAYRVEVVEHGRVRQVADDSAKSGSVPLSFQELPRDYNQPVLPRLCRVCAVWSDGASSADLALGGGRWAFPLDNGWVWVADLRSADGSAWWATREVAGRIGIEVRASKAGHWMCVGRSRGEPGAASWDGRTFTGTGALVFPAHEPVVVRRASCSFRASVPERVCVDLEENLNGEDGYLGQSSHGISFEMGRMPGCVATVSIDGAAPVPMDAFAPGTIFRAESLALRVDRRDASAIELVDIAFTREWNVRIRISAD